MIVDHLATQLPGAILEHHDFRGDQTLVVSKVRFLEIVDCIYGEGFQWLVDITAVDAWTRDPRFDVVYHWLNLASQERLRIKVRVQEGESVPSLVQKVKGANWFEREVYDMFGIAFEGHPDLRRLLMWDDFQAHPLRKDFPRNGFDGFCEDTGVSFSGHACSLAE